ncbi:MAG: phosphoglycerate kinase [Xanthomonadales bacterium]|nr:phosphoglycerate kinase [Xanthomonadales bacterium]
MRFLRMAEVALGGRRVLIREDLNVPVEEGRIRSAERLEAALPTLRQALAAGARVLVMSHLGRPEEGRFDPALSLAPVARWLAAALGREVPLVGSLEAVPEIVPGALALLENVRFNPGERRDDPALARRYAALCDVFVMDAFATAHRAEASTHGVIRFAPVACAGPLLAAELDALGRALERPARPLLAVVGGAKVSSKLGVLEHLLGRVDALIVGGGIANTFLAARGLPVGRSLYEPELIPTAARILGRAAELGVEIGLPEDAVVAAEARADAATRVVPVTEVGAEDRILDVGPATAARHAEWIARAGTVVWNGPLGLFELEPFAAGTRRLAEAIAASPAFSIAGGGDTLAAVAAFGVADRLGYLSTGGGAFLEFLEGRSLPAVAALCARADSGAGAAPSG